MNTKRSADRARRLLKRVQADIDGSASDGVVLNDLLEDFCTVLQIEDVLPLLESANGNVARAGAWIISELGSRACCLFPTIKQHLESHDPTVRFCLADSVLLCANGAHADSLAKIAEFLEDPDPSVRWKAIDTLVKLSPAQVSACARYLEASGSRGHFLSGFKQLMRPTPNGTRRSRQAQTATDTITNKFAFIAAVRSRAAEEELERIVSSSNDQDLASFLADFER